METPGSRPREEAARQRQAKLAVPEQFTPSCPEPPGTEASGSYRIAALGCATP